MKAHFDIIVIGAGHAGCEAATAASRLGMRVALITSDITKTAQMSCNPSIGGIGKGQIVREIDALGGFTAVVTDRTSIQFRLLNRSKGPAMHSPRAQCDRDLFTLEWRRILDHCENLTLIQDTIEALHIQGNRCLGAVSQHWGIIESKKVILTSGTFLNGLIHIGLKNKPGGRIDESSVPNLSEQLTAQGIETLRFKTGTSPRIDIRTINQSEFEEQWGDTEERYFSFSSVKPNGLIQRPCLLGYTNETVHDIIRTNLDKSPLYQKVIHGRGPRYCPSIEDKIHIFSEKKSHQIFLEPENAIGNLVYINGFSSSLPFEVQCTALRSVKGLEQVHIVRPGYAIEYDFFNPKQLHKSLESSVVENLFIAGQLNGTTGYEEAAAQGLIAGINATHSIQNKPPIILERSEAYIGVMIDDLITNGVDEPYRMFTSRAERRLSLRQENADRRLMGIGYELGLVSKEQYEKCLSKYEAVKKNISILEQISLAPREINPVLEKNNSSTVNQRVKARQIILRPEINLTDLLPLFKKEGISFDSSSPEIIQSTEIEIKYARYIEKENEGEKLDIQLKALRIPTEMDIKTITSISYEAREKIQKYKPSNLYELKKIPGITPSDLKTLIIAINNYVPRGT